MILRNMHWSPAIIVMLVIVGSFAQTPPCTTPNYSPENACYWERTSDETWAEALAGCEADGGTLMAMPSSEMFDFVDTHLSLGIEDHWIGLSDQTLKSVFRWTDKRPVAWNNWKSDRPSGDYRCVVLKADKTWEDKDCTTGYKSFCMSPPVAGCTDFNDNCNENYVPANPRCYVKLDTGGNQAAHRTTCADNGYELLRIYSEDDKIRAQAAAQADPAGDVWMDAVQDTNTKIWRTSDGMVLTWANWHNDRDPDHVDTEFCIKFKQDGRFDNKDCGEDRTATLCMAPANCSSTQSAQNAYSSSNGSHAVYTCFDGYQDSSGVTTWSFLCDCDTDYAAQATAYTCEAIFCPDVLPTLNNGIVNVPSMNTYQSNASITCTNGYSTAQASITCQMNGTWSTPRDCLAITCPFNLPTLNNGYVNAPVSYTYLSTANIVCSTGYNTAQSPITCQLDGTWSSPQDCSAVSCSSTLPWSTGAMQTVSDATGYTYLSTFNMTCNSGYRTAAGDELQTSTCQATGVWSSLQPCQAVDCGSSLPSVNNGVAGSVTSSSYQAEVEVTCDSGYAAADGNAIKLICNTEGVWTQTQECVSQPAGATTATTAPDTSTSEITTDSPTATESNATDPTSASSTASNLTSASSTAASPTAATPTAASSTDASSTDANPTDAASTATDPTAAGNTASSPTAGASSAPTQPETSTSDMTTDAINTAQSVASQSMTSQYTQSESWVTSETPVSSSGTSGSSTSPVSPSATGGSTAPMSTTPPSQTTECDPPPAFQFARRNQPTGALIPGVAVEYMCDPGYVFEGGGNSRSYVCMDNRQWHATFTDCVQKTCPSLPLPNASPEVADAHAGEDVTVTCNAGTRSTDGRDYFKLACGHNHSWDKESPNCAENRCPPFPHLEAAVASPMYTSDDNTTVTVTCHRGHHFIDSTSVQDIVCADKNGEQTWMVGIYHTCHIDVCPPLPVAVNATYNISYGAFGDVVEQTCSYGNAFPNMTTKDYLRCEEFGIWDKYPQNCTEVVCDEPPEVESCTRVVGGTRFDDVTTYTCDSGLRTEDGSMVKDVTCTISSTWSEDQITCAPGRCPPLPTPVNASVNIISADPGAVITVTCDAGHRFSSGNQEKFVVCQNEVWDDTDTVCEPLDCGNVTVYDHSTPNSSNTLYPSLVSYWCTLGYQWTSELPAIITCQGNGLWSQLPARCEPLPCPDPPIVHGAWHDSMQLEHVYQDHITYTCEEGTWFTRGVYNKSYTCGPWGEWEPATEHCIDITCVPLAVWEGVMISSSDIHVGAMVNVSCTENFAFQNSPDNSTVTIECNTAGQWEPNNPQCIEVIQIPYVAPVEEAPKAAAIGTLAIILLTVVPVLIITADGITVGMWIYSYYRRRALHRMDT